MKKLCKYKDHIGDRNVLIELMTKDKYRKDGYGDICKICGYKRKKDYIFRVRNNEIGLQTHESLKAIHRKRTKKLRHKHGLSHALFMSAKSRAKKKGLFFNLTMDDINIPEYCPILGIKIEKSLLEIDQSFGKKMGVNNLPWNYPSIDRMDSTKGYTKDNIHIICWRANHLKSDATFEEIEKLYQWVNQLTE
jgi:hypothetical protein